MAVDLTSLNTDTTRRNLAKAEEAKVGDNLAAFEALVREKLQEVAGGNARVTNVLLEQLTAAMARTGLSGLVGLLNGSAPNTAGALPASNAPVTSNPPDGLNEDERAAVMAVRFHGLTFDPHTGMPVRIEELEENVREHESVVTGVERHLGLGVTAGTSLRERLDTIKSEIDRLSAAGTPTVTTEGVLRQLLADAGVSTARTAGMNEAALQGEVMNMLEAGLSLKDIAMALGMPRRASSESRKDYTDKVVATARLFADSWKQLVAVLNRRLGSTDSGKTTVVYISEIDGKLDDINKSNGNLKDQVTKYDAFSKDTLGTDRAGADITAHLTALVAAVDELKAAVPSAARTGRLRNFFSGSGTTGGHA